MAFYGIDRVDGEAAVPQDPGGKIRDLYSISVAFPEHAEIAGQSPEHQAFQVFPVVQSVSVMDILGDVAHDRIRTVPQAVGERAICHHAEILRLVDDHMACLADAVGLLDALINVGEGCQVIQVKLIFRSGNALSFFLLLIQEAAVNFKNRSLPHACSEMPPVLFQNLFFYFERIAGGFGGHLIFQLCVQDCIEHVDLSLHGHERIALNVVPDRRFLHDKGAIFKKYAFLRDRRSLELLAEALQIMEPFIAPLDPCAAVLFVEGADVVYLGIPVLVEEAHEELLHGHLGYAVYIQVRQDAGDIVQEDPVASDDIEIFRAEVLLIVIQDVGNAVHRHGRLS